MVGVYSHQIITDVFGQQHSSHIEEEEEIQEEEEVKLDFEIKISETSSKLIQPDEKIQKGKSPNNDEYVMEKLEKLELIKPQINQL